MRLIVVLVIVGGVSAAIARTLQQTITHGTLIWDNHGALSPSKRAAKAALVLASVTVAIFVPLLFVAYVAIGLIGHALG
jgi:hypothetical protein